MCKISNFVNHCKLVKACIYVLQYHTPLNRAVQRKGSVEARHLVLAVSHDDSTRSIHLPTHLIHLTVHSIHLPACLLFSLPQTSRICPPPSRRSCLTRCWTETCRKVRHSLNLCARTHTDTYRHGWRRKSAMCVFVCERRRPPSRSKPCSETGSPPKLRSRSVACIFPPDQPAVSAAAAAPPEDPDFAVAHAAHVWPNQPRAQ